MKDNTDADYAHAKRVCKDIKIKKLGYYQDLYVQSDTSLLADVVENFQNTSLEMHELDPAHFLSSPGLAWQAFLNINKIKYQNKIRASNCYSHVISGRKIYQRWNMSCYSSICKS